MRTKVVNLSASGVIAGGECWLDGMYINSTSSGVLHLHHSPTQAVDEGHILAGAITPAIGSHNLFGLHATAGLYCDIASGSMNVTFFLRESD